MINTIERAYSELVSMRRESEINNSTLVALLEEKLPRDIRREWVALVTGDKRMEIGRNKFPHLLKLLRSFSERIEYEFSELRSPTNRVSANYADMNGKTVPSSASYADMKEKIVQSSGNSTRKPWCWKHPNEETHPIWRCEQFSERSADIRLELVRNNNACYRCLQQGHSARFCRKHFTCKVDNRGQPHHYLLHEANHYGHSHYGQKRIIRKGEESEEVLLQLQKVKGKNSVGELRNINIFMGWG